MTLHLLDTNIVSHIVRQDQPMVLRRLLEIAVNDVAISAVTKGELFFGLARRKPSSSLAQAIKNTLETLAVLPWTGTTAEIYGDLKASCMSRGIGLDPLDMMIAAHALALNATLVTRDKAFMQIADVVKVKNWA